MTFNHTPRRRFTDQQRLAFFEKHRGICHLCGLKIKPLEPWQIEHVIARELLGPMADEDENLRPAHVDCHKAKTKQDRADIAKSNHVRAKWSGAHRPKQRLGNGNNQHTATRHLTKGVGLAYFEDAK